MLSNIEVYSLVITAYSSIIYNFSPNGKNYLFPFNINFFSTLPGRVSSGIFTGTHCPYTMIKK